MIWYKLRNKKKTPTITIKTTVNFCVVVVSSIGTNSPIKVSLNLLEMVGVRITTLMIKLELPMEILRESEFYAILWQMKWTIVRSKSIGPTTINISHWSILIQIHAQSILDWCIYSTNDDDACDQKKNEMDTITATTIAIDGKYNEDNTEIYFVETIKLLSFHFPWMRAPK